MRTITLRSNAIAIFALAALFLLWNPGSALAQKEVFTRSKPHVNVGTVGGEPADIWFHANASVFDDGKATGVLQFRAADGEAFLYRVVQGEATVVRATVIELSLILERVGEDGAATGEIDLAIVRPDPMVEDCLIYTTVGSDVRLEAEGLLELKASKKEKKRP